ncbi:MAG: hypothetical protein R3B06_02855 [Kofleriaceae bacterium]
MSRLLIIASLVACHGGGSADREAGAANGPDRTKPGPTAAYATSVAAPPPDGDAEVDAGSTSPPRSSVVLTVDGRTRTLRFGHALASWGDLVIDLSEGPLGCDNRVAPSFGGVGDWVTFSLPPGPDRGYFAGPAVGAAIVANAATGTTIIGAGGATLTVALSGRTEGARVRGTLDGSSATLVGTTTVTGSFDVELCDALPDTVAHARPPAGPVHGRRGSTRLSVRTVHANVISVGRTYDEAVDLALGRAPGSLRRIADLTFYDRADVPCPPAGATEAAGFQPLFKLQDPGGADLDHPLLGTPQPAAVIFTGATAADPGAVWPAWVQFDTIGTTVAGVVGATASPVDPVSGQLAGRFRAVVCGPDRPVRAR